MTVVWLFRALLLVLCIQTFDCFYTGGNAFFTSIRRDRKTRSDAFVTVDTTYGTVRGKVDAAHNVTVNRFYGIPYAKPPLGSLRFRAPVSPDSWNGVKDALQFSSECLQITDTVARIKNGDVPPTWSEDCLYLNVYSPSHESGLGSLPVMVWIHGGGYMIGAGSQYDGTTFATKGVVLVTINYRLDVFGFLSTEDDAIPGNYGMLDQIAALKWVQENIAAFGGDPNQVTIFGESAGASSVSLLMLSPMAKGLFHRGIMESGASISSWATDHPANKVSLKMASRLIGKVTKCNDIDDSVKLLSCLQKVDGKKLLNVSISVDRALGAGTSWKPRVETTFGFLPDLPVNLFSRGEFNDVETIRGFNSNEMDTFFTYIQTNGTRAAIKTALDGALLSLLTPYTPLLQSEILEMLKSEFLSSSASNELMVQQAAGAGNDLLVIAATIKELELVLGKISGKKHYLYEFNHRPSYKTYPIWISAVHGDEIPFVFGSEQKQFTENARDGPPNACDIEVSAKVMDMWTSFAKFGDPTPKHTLCSHSWPSYTLNMANYLLINPLFTAKVWSRPQVVAFYDRVIELMDGVKSGNNIIG